jgi:16S rRNA G527 N7-methylase RsmG
MRYFLLDEITIISSDLHISLSSKQLEEIKIHDELLARWGRRMNLTSIEDPSERARRLFMEGIAVGDFLQRKGASGPFVDLGSGNGFPAVPIAALCTRARPIIFLESSHKKAAFLRALIRELDWVDARVDERHVHSSTDLTEFGCRLFSSRGVDLSDLLSEELSFVEPDGLCVLFGSKSRGSLSHLPSSLVPEHEILLPWRDSPIHILRKSE